MSQVSNAILASEIAVEDDTPPRESRLSPEVSASMNAEARRRIERMREEAALRRALNDDDFDY